MNLYGIAKGKSFEKTIEHSIPEELDHAKRLEEAMSACGIKFWYQKNLLISSRFYGKIFSHKFYRSWRLLINKKININ